MKRTTGSRKDHMIFALVTIAFGLIGGLSKAGYGIKRSPNDSVHHAAIVNKPSFVKIEPLVKAPSDPAQWGPWRTELAVQRQHVREQMAYDDMFYQRPEFNWVSSCYSCYFLMMYDERFYNRKQNQYTVDSLIEDGIERFGGYDAIVACVPPDRFR